MLSPLLKLFRHHPHITVDLSDKTLKVGQICWTMVFSNENQATLMVQRFLLIQHNKNICINAVLHGTSIDITVDYEPNVEQAIVHDVIASIITAEKETKGE